MALTFDPQTGMAAEDTQAIRERRAAAWKDAFRAAGNETTLNTDPETPAGQLVDGETALISQKDSELLVIANGFDPKTATGIFQDALGAIYFISRHVAEPTVVTCQCRGLQGTTIPAGAVIQDVNGNNYPVSYTHLTLPTMCQV